MIPLRIRDDGAARDPSISWDQALVGGALGPCGDRNIGLVVGAFRGRPVWLVGWALVAAEASPEGEA
jgi:hypothetical protein